MAIGEHESLKFKKTAGKRRGSHKPTNHD